MNEIGQRINTLRQSLGLTLEDIGKSVGVGKSTVRKWETGQIANMRRDKIAKLADALHVSPAYLMGWKENPAPLSESEANAEKPAAETGSELSEDAQRIAMKASLLSEESRKVLEDYIDFLAAKGRQ